MRISRLIQRPGRLTVCLAAAALAGAGTLGASGAHAAAPASSVSAATTAGGCTQTTSSTDVAIPGNVEFYQRRHSILGLHRWYQQVKGGKPVAGGWWGWHRNTDTGEITVEDCRRSTGKLNATTPTVRPGAAAAIAKRSTATDVLDHRLTVLPIGSRGGSRLTWAITSVSARGGQVSYVDAVTGSVLKTTSISASARSPKLTSGTARVFDPNPVVKLQDESLRDHADSATSVPGAGYSVRSLAHLNGEGSTLIGLWARVVNDDRVTSPTATYKFNRANDAFEQVMGYYALDTEQSYLRRLGFSEVNAESQRIETDAFSDDNSYYLQGVDLIRTGRGGVDDAEDPEVVWHEYGHAIQDDQVPFWGLRYQGAAIGEGFGDYMAVTMSQIHADDTATTPLACVMDWDATSYDPGAPHCLRRTDTNKNWTGHADGDPHIDGEIWSAALWDMSQALGRNVATTIAVEAQFWMNPKIDFAAAAEATVTVASELYPNNPTIADTVQQAFTDRGLI
jgi:hypothetical protein